MILFVPSFILIFLSIIRNTQQTYSNLTINTLSQNQETIFQNFKAYDNFGYSVSGAGDFNDDGYNDLVIGSTGANTSTGIVYVLFGSKNGLTDLTISSSLTPNQSLIIYGPESAAQLGYSVKYAGDVNDDGIDDIIISSWASQGRGVVYVLYGSKTLPSVINLKQGLDVNQGFAIIGASPQDLLGVCVSGIGDVNNDGVDDFAVGAVGVSNKKGAVYVIFGRKGTRPNITLTSSGMSSTEGFRVLGGFDMDYLGYSISKCGDLNGDGIDDLLFGGIGVNNWAGSIFVIFGNKSTPLESIDLSKGLNSDKGFAITANPTSDYFGVSVAGIGDFNGDGRNDIVVGAHAQNAFRGAVYVIFGREGISNMSLTSGFDFTRGFRIQGASTLDALGQFTAGVGDYNGDGLNDILISAHQANGMTGVAYVIFGNKNIVSNINLGDGLSPDQGFAIASTYTYDALASGLSNVGDMNQDGMDDFLLAAYHGANRPGGAYLLYTPLVCPSACLTCTKRSICQTCQTGYGLYNSMCVSCPLFATKLVDGVCVSIKSSPLPTKVAQGLFNSGSMVSRIFTMGRSLSVGLGLIAKIIQNVRFLNISYPLEALTAFESYGTDLFQLPIPEMFYETPETKQLPSQYSRYDISPTFLENYWQTIMLMLISLACILVIKFFQILTKHQKKEHILQVTLKNVGQTAANFLVIQIYSSLDDVIFFYLLDTSTTKVSSPSAGISLGIGTCFLFLGLALVFFHCWLLSQYQRAKMQKTLERFKAKFHFLGTLFEDFKDDTMPKQMFFGVLILRCVFLVLVIMLLQPPWIQASLLMLANLIFFGYLIHQRPFKSLFDEVVQYFCELTVFAAYLSVLILAIFDFQDEELSSARDLFGKTIVIAGIVLCLGGFIIQMIQIFGAMYGIYKFCKNYFGSKKGKISTTLKLRPRPNGLSVENSPGLQNQIENPNQITSSDFTLQNNHELEISYANSEGPLMMMMQQKDSRNKNQSNRARIQAFVNQPQFDQRITNLEGQEISSQLDNFRRPKKFKRKQRISETNADLRF